MNDQILEAWRGHYLAGERRLEDDDVIVVDPRCGSCGAVPGPDDWPQAWFAKHLEEKGAEEYAVGFERYWRSTVTRTDGTLDLDKVARELYDYTRVENNASHVFGEISGFSKTLTDPVYILGRNEERAAAWHAQLLMEVIEGQGCAGLTADEVRSLALSWSEEGVAQHEDNVITGAEIRAEHAEPGR